DDIGAHHLGNSLVQGNPRSRQRTPAPVSGAVATKENDMKAVNAFAIAAVLLCLMVPSSGRAQSALPPVPTTRILAIGTINPGVEPAAVRAILPTEVRETVKLYLDGKIDQWFSLQGRNGVAFILNVTDTGAAHDMLEKLPLGQAHLMSFELIPLGPLNPLRQL